VPVGHAGGMGETVLESESRSEERDIQWFGGAVETHRRAEHDRPNKKKEGGNDKETKGGYFPVG